MIRLSQMRNPRFEEINSLAQSPSARSDRAGIWTQVFLATRVLFLLHYVISSAGECFAPIRWGGTGPARIQRKGRTVQKRTFPGRGLRSHPSCPCVVLLALGKLHEPLLTILSSIKRGLTISEPCHRTPRDSAHRCV